MDAFPNLSPERDQGILAKAGYLVQVHAQQLAGIAFDGHFGGILVGTRLFIAGFGSGEVLSMLTKQAIKFLVQLGYLSLYFLKDAATGPYLEANANRPVTR